MTEGPLFGKIVLFALPLMLSGILQLLYNAADIVVVGRFAENGQTALAAVGSTGALTNLIVNLFIGLSVGTSVAVSHALGARNDEDVHKLVHTSILTSLIGGVIVSLIGILLSRPLLALMDTPETVINHSVLYMRIIFLGMPAQMLYNYGAAVLRAKGDTKRPLFILALTGLVNVALNLILVMGFHLDVAGVAIATITAQYLSALLSTYFLIRDRGACHLELKRLHIDRRSFLRILRIGIPAGIQGMAFSISNVLIQSSVNSFGETAMAGNTAGSNLDGFIYIALNALYHAALTFTGQNVGAKKWERLNRVLFNCAAIVLVLGLVMGFGIYLLGEPLLTIYAPGEPEVIEWGMIRLKYLATTYFLCGLMEVGCGMLRGIGQSFTSMIISLTGTCAMRVIWIFTIFALNHTMPTLYLSYPVTWIITCAVDFICYAIFKRKLIARINALDAVHAA
ncbi:MAG: MATE family efflux transporter [Clostridia bacterium]|nr:MATE family efflux transporter [Clostridia bacterium]